MFGKPTEHNICDYAVCVCVCSKRVCENTHTKRSPDEKHLHVSRNIFYVRVPSSEDARCTDVYVQIIIIIIFFGRLHDRNINNNCIKYNKIIIIIINSIWSSSSLEPLPPSRIVVWTVVVVVSGVEFLWAHFHADRTGWGIVEGSAAIVAQQVR